ncbi:variant erythrocyte surface antigen-1 alpha subunit [Babesia bovis T2Bo]|uniref:variant erythrocyte surface antigen-1 alpha subunit n=1 Tax=Babesia bovis T2Bo TaxID=484906 RepID=UPI001D4D8175|nr:variant erythrocyte surface antigen-1 alpha subunit [Babesia bovis T2Bo]EDO07145.2 variant erythrocyte surface antigen-1 alpha subunit [Babesia bovis T2Bo]
MKWDVADADNESKGHHLGRRCTKCSDSGGGVLHRCQCSTGGSSTCTAATCKCALAGKCCKCCCKSCPGKCNKECTCIIEDGVVGRDECNRNSYMSAYPSKAFYQRTKYVESKRVDVKPYWKDVESASNRHQCARILLGSVCLIWSGITYLYWTGKYHWSSPRWNNHILDGSGLDDGTLSQWLQALGFPRDMLNNSGPQNRLDKVIWDGISDKLLLGFAMPSGLYNSGVHDTNDNTARQPAGMNYPGFIHTAHRDSFNEQAIVFKNGSSSTSDIDQHKQGALFKLYILSCAYFTGLQRRNSESTPRTPKTIREILYWLSALPYSEAYPKILQHSKGVLEKVAPDVENKKQLSFYQTGRTAPITVHEFNLFAHFQAVTQYCPLVLIGIQGGLKGTDRTKEPSIHALYANTECNFTYPSVPIQAYNQVVHYIRALFYQLYFLRKQCAVKVALGGKWRECRYGKDVVSKGVISWMCMGCSPMEHDRKKRVAEMGNKLNKLPLGSGESVAMKVKTLLEKIGEVVVQLGNAQEALEGKKKEAIEGVKGALGEAKRELEGAKNGLNGKLEEAKDGLKDKLQDAMTKLGELTNGGGILVDLLGSNGLEKAAEKGEYDPGKNKISEAIHKVRSVMEEIQKELGVSNSSYLNGSLSEWVANTLHKTIDQIKDICNTPKCSACDSHSKKCGQPSTPSICRTCLQPTTTGVPSPLQAFLEDRLPGFSCDEVRNDEKDNPDYPLASSHLGHCNGSGQCCPLPMGFRGQFQKDGITNMTGQRLYGILYFFSNENMMQSCVYTLVRVTAELSATTPQVLGDVFGFFRGGVGNKDSGKTKNAGNRQCDHQKDPSQKGDTDYFCGWCASGLRDEVKKIEWIPKKDGDGGQYRGTVGQALINIKGEKSTSPVPYSDATTTTNTSLSRLTKNCQYLSPLTGELYTAVSATFGGTYLSWVLYLSDALEGGLKSLSDAFQQIECRGCRECDPNKCKKGSHGVTGGGLCGCQSIVSCTGVLPVLYRHGFSYGNPFNLEGCNQKEKEKGDYSITADTKGKKQCHDFLSSLSAVINKNKQDPSKGQDQHPLTNLLSQVGQLQYDIRLPWVFVLTLAWLVAVLYLAFGAIWPLDWTHMRSHWLRGGAHQWECMWYKVMTGRKGRVVLEGVENFGQCLVVLLVMF